MAWSLGRLRGSRLHEALADGLLAQAELSNAAQNGQETSNHGRDHYIRPHSAHRVPEVLGLLFHYQSVVDPTTTFQKRLLFPVGWSYTCGFLVLLCYK